MQVMSRKPRSITPGGWKLFLTFTLLATIAVNALPSMASEAKVIPTKTVLSYTAATGKAIFTAKVSPSGATGSVLFFQGPLDNRFLLGVVFLVHGIAKLQHLPSGIPKGYQQFQAVYLGSSRYETSASNIIHATIK
jgi:hypothetical protein